MSSSSSSSTVSVSAHLHLAPTPARPFSQAHLRALVLEYLTSSAFPDSASAFAREVHERDEQRQRNHALVRPPASRSRSRSRSDAGWGSHPMDGVEATPPPEIIRDRTHSRANGHPRGDTPMNGLAHAGDDDGDVGGAELGSSGPSNGAHSNGKAVAFEHPDSDAAADDAAEDDRDWPMLSLSELQEVRLRRDIREHILTGQITQAVELIMEHFPSVLDPVAFPPTPTPPVSRSPRKAAAAALAAASSPHSFFVPTPTSVSEHRKSPPPPVPVLGAAFSPAALSLAPAILSLNLQLQSFVELLRTANSTSRASTPTRSDSPMSGSTSSLASVGKSAGGGMGKVIKQGQKLAAKVATLPIGKERTSWEQEILEVSGLMAYIDLSICPVRGYLSQDRREALAELVNAAILHHLKRTPMPVITLVARQTSSVWQTLADWKHPFPPPEPSQAKPRHKTYPRFDLHEYLEEDESSAVDPRAS